MRQLRFAGTVCVIGVLAVLPAAADYRVAYSADGNKHDADDWHASPMALALLAAAGAQDRLVHFDYNNHLGENEPWRAATHRRRVTGAIRRFGYDPSRFFDDQQDLAGAVASIARAIDSSSAADRLYLLCAGPMEVCWRGIDAADDRREPFVTVISHGRWNAVHADTPQMTHVWADIVRDFQVEAVEIANQNNFAFRSAPADWQWLKQQVHGQWLHGVVTEGRKAGDASDAGMMFYLLDGRHPASERPTMARIRAMFGTAGP